MTSEERRDNLYRQPAKSLNIDILRERLGKPGKMADRPGMLAYFERLVRAEASAEGFEKGKWAEQNDPGDNDDFSMTANYYHQD